MVKRLHRNQSGVDLDVVLEERGNERIHFCAVELHVLADQPVVLGGFHVIGTISWRILAADACTDLLVGNELPRRAVSSTVHEDIDTKRRRFGPARRALVSGDEEPERVSFILAAGSAAFVLPYVLLAAPAGYLADRYSKQKVIVACKVAEIFIMLLAVVAIKLGSVPLMMVVVAAMGAQSALFGPAKLGTTLARSSANVSVYAGSAESASRNMPCAFA